MRSVLALFLLCVLPNFANASSIFDCHVKSQGATQNIGVIELDTSLAVQPAEKLRVEVDGQNFAAYCNVNTDAGNSEKDIWCGFGGLPGNPGPSARAQTSESASYLLLDRVEYSNGRNVNGWFEIYCVKRTR